MLLIVAIAGGVGIMLGAAGTIAVLVVDLALIRPHTAHSTASN
jgi:hypothetical protein